MADPSAWAEGGRRRLHRMKARVRSRIRRDLTADDLRRAGVRLGDQVALEAGVWVDLEWGWLVQIGDLVTMAPGVKVFAHDASTRRALGYTKVAPVAIGDRVYLGAGTIVLPGVHIGDDVIVGAGSVVARDLPASTLAAGSPARVLCSAADYLGRRTAQLEQGPVLDRLRPDERAGDWTTRRDEAMRRIGETGVGWVR